MRGALGRLLGGDRFKRQVIVMGAGPRAAQIVELAKRPGANFLVVGVIAMSDAERVLPQAIHREDIPNLQAFVVGREVVEVVLALEERRRALPYQDLLRVRTGRRQVFELSSFLERDRADRSGLGQP
jgi:hypothetical protein